MSSGSDALTFGAIDDDSLPLVVLMHGFPDTPHTWRHLGPQLAAHGYRVVAPWLPGYAAAVSHPVSVGTYVRHTLDVRAAYRGDERAVLIGHDWGANAGYGAISFAPSSFSKFVSLAIPPTAALGAGLFSYPQLKRSFYIWFIQQVGLADAVLLQDGFWEGLWADWSPGYDATADLRELRRWVGAETIAGVVNPYRAAFNPDFADPSTESEAAASMDLPPIPTLYLHGSMDGAIGAELLTDLPDYFPSAGVVVRGDRRGGAFPAPGTARRGLAPDQHLAIRLAGGGSRHPAATGFQPRGVAQLGQELVRGSTLNQVVAHCDSHDRCRGDVGCFAGDHVAQPGVHGRQHAAHLGQHVSGFDVDDGSCRE